MPGLLCGVQVYAYYGSPGPLILVVTTKENKTVYRDIEISKGFSYVISFPGNLMFGVGRVVGTFLPPLV